jgi:hypothetical protein
VPTERILGTPEVYLLKKFNYGDYFCEFKLNDIVVISTRTSIIDRVTGFISGIWIFKDHNGVQAPYDIYSATVYLESVNRRKKEDLLKKMSEPKKMKVPKNPKSRIYPGFVDSLLSTTDVT